MSYRIRSLADGNQFHDPDGLAAAAGISSANWPLFGMTWPAGLMLAGLASREPFGRGRVLELGCGLGIASLVANARGADILASDQHPMAADFLRGNSARNGLADTPFRRVDWAVRDDGLALFDCIMGSDLLYEPDHPALLAAFMARHSHAGTRILIVAPMRRLHGRFLRLMEAAGFASRSETASTADFDAYGFKGVIQRFDGFNPPARG